MAAIAYPGRAFTPASVFSAVLGTPAGAARSHGGLAFDGLETMHVTPGHPPPTTGIQPAPGLGSQLDAGGLVEWAGMPYRMPRPVMAKFRSSRAETVPIPGMAAVEAAEKRAQHGFLRPGYAVPLWMLLGALVVALPLLARSRRRNAAFGHGPAADRSAQGSAWNQATLGRMTGGIAHDFNNFLTSMLTFNQLAMLEAKPGTKVHRYLEGVEQAGTQAKHLVRQIVDFGHDRREGARLIDLARIVKDAVPLVRVSVPKTVDLEIDIEPSEGRLYGSPVDVVRILLNLCANAMDAMGQRGGRLILGLAAEGDNHQVLTVADSGCGMGRDVQAHMFEAEYTTKPPGRGSGMGLYLVRVLVRNMGGTIAVESVPDQGTTIRVCLPLNNSARIRTREVAASAIYSQSGASS